jgi:indoleamine 2,3-dioxygenase
MAEDISSAYNHATWTPDAVWGFLDPAIQHTALPAAFGEIQGVAECMGDLLKRRELRGTVSRLQTVEFSEKVTPAQFRHLWTIYSMISSAYVFSTYEEENARALPESIARPLYLLAQRQGVPPIMNYDGYVQNNFYIRPTSVEKPDTELAAEDIDALYTFSSPDDEKVFEGEKWFIVVQAMSEKILAPAIQKIPLAQRALINGDDDFVIETLTVVTNALMEMGKLTKRLPERLDESHYKSAAPLPYLFTFRDITFEGVPELGPQTLRPMSGGQSAIPRVLGAFLGVDREPADMAALGEYIPQQHRAYMARVQEGMSVRSALAQRPLLIDPYNKAMEALKFVRLVHRGIAVKYIGPEVLQPGPSGSRYLEENIEATQEAVFAPERK